MKKSLIALAVAGAISVPAIAQEAASPHTFTGNVTIASDYVFRGISQTQHKPAIQGGFDYSHASGFYAGIWSSNVAWVKEGGFKDNSSLEVDVYGGYRGAIGDFGYDVGALHYYYPGDTNTTNNFPNPDSTEVYVGVSWKFLSLKYSHAVSSHLFGWVNPTSNEKSRGSNYLDLTATHDFGNGWGGVAHVGRQTIKNYSDASYTDWKIGVTKDLGFGVAGLTYTDSNAKGSCPFVNTQPYCWGTAPRDKDVSESRVVLSFSKSF
ncbi:TorF family putative porin [Azonexus hydrophilus]|jgi:uncharacterized protein (TIGR02001 family)|uniref:TorF family putative porin n=1 Tax=Azonexus hydrophilus TaxID=418702 RepID=A0ABZ2XIR6_9RHOO|nr:TorF family putative porin [Azonexus hydrophilus]MBS4017230.1 TorF family putative porin [Dechloromonas sp.]